MVVVVVFIDAPSSLLCTYTLECKWNGIPINHSWRLLDILCYLVCLATVISILCNLIQRCRCNVDDDDDVSGKCSAMSVTLQCC